MAFFKSGLVNGLVCATSALVLAGCVEQQGFSSRDDELTRVRGETRPFDVISLNHERAVVTARGRQVAIEAADGFCLAKESIETSGRSAFALIGDCVLDDPQSSKRAAAASLPRGVPGIITVSISGDRGYTRDGNGAGSLSDLGEFLKTAEGRKMLGRGGAGNSVSIKESRTIDDGYYVLVEDKNTDLVPIFASRFWRSFVDLNDRLTVVTISSFRDKPLGKDEMLKHLINQVKTLSVANREPLNEPRTFVAEAGSTRQDTPEVLQSLADLVPDELVVTAEVTREDVQSPLPLGRPKIEAATEATDPAEGDVVEAPKEADPAIALEIAAATEAIPVPTARGGSPAAVAEDAAPAESAETPDVVKPQSEAAIETAETSTPAEDEQQATEVANVDTADPQPQPAGATTKPEETGPSDTAALVAAAPQDDTAPVATPAQNSATDQQPAATAPAAKPDAAPAAETDTPAEKEAVAATEEAAPPEEDAAPTAFAPANAPEAPKRPRQG